MGGTWQTSSPPTRPGAYFNFQQAAVAAINGGVVGVVAVIGHSDWGPANLATPVGSQAQFDEAFGQGGNLRDAVLGALDGMNTGGAATVLAYRVASADIATAEIAIGAGLKIRAKQPGSRGNAFSVVVENAPGVANPNKNLLLLEDGVLLEEYLNIENLNEEIVRDINGMLSPYIVAEQVGAAGQTVTNATYDLTGGNDGAGATLDVAEYTQALYAMEGQEMNFIAIANLDPTVDPGGQDLMDAFVDWVIDQNENMGKRIMAVVGGGLGDSFADAIARSDDIDDPNIVNLGATDIRRLSDEAVLSTAEMAPRIAGTLAAIGVSRSLTYVKWDGYQVHTPLTGAQYTASIKQGLVVFTNDSPVRVRVEAGMTSLQTTNATDRPEAFRKIRNMAISHFIQTQLTFVANEFYLGVISNTETARNDLVGNFLSFLKALETGSVLAPGSQVSLDDRFPQVGNAMYLTFDVSYVDSIERIFTTVKIG